MRGKNFSVIGKPLPRIDGMAKCTGETRYANDIELPRMIYAKLLRSPYPHARIRGIDVTKALKTGGVYAVITGRDLPEKFGILPSTQIAGVPVHRECDLLLGQGKRCQLTAKGRLEEMIRHEQQKRFVQNPLRLEYRKTIFFLPIFIHQRSDPNRKTFLEPHQEIADLVTLIAGNDVKFIHPDFPCGADDTFDYGDAQDGDKGFALTPLLQPTALARSDNQASHPHRLRSR